MPLPEKLTKPFRSIKEKLTKKKVAKNAADGKDLNGDEKPATNGNVDNGHVNGE
jgi:hypothetical protein